MYGCHLPTTVLARLYGARYGADVMVDLRTHLRRALRKRWAKATEQDKKEAAAHASRAYWDGLTPEQRSVEMKRRAKVRTRKREKAGKAGKSQEEEQIKVCLGLG